MEKTNSILKNHLIIIFLFLITYSVVFLSCSKDDGYLDPGIWLSVKIQTYKGYKTDGAVFLYNLDENNIKDYTPKFINGIPYLQDINGKIVIFSDLETYTQTGSISGYNKCYFVLDYNKIGHTYLPKGKYLVLITEDSKNPLKIICGRYSYEILDIQESMEIEKTWSEDNDSFFQKW